MVILQNPINSSTKNQNQGCINPLTGRKNLMFNNIFSGYSVLRFIHRTILCFLVFTVFMVDEQITHADTLLINNVTVIDATGSLPKSGMSVLVADGVIKSIQPVVKITKPAGSTVIDASGMFLIPGLWDMHVHANYGFFLPLFIANGVTGVREMWGRDIHHKWRKRIGEKGFISPRFYIASIIIDGDPPVWPGSIGVKDAEQARKEVDKFYKLGADFIKVYSRLNRPSYFAIADECKKLGIPFAGHVPNSVSAAKASTAGQKSIEHLTGINTANNDAKAKELYQLFIKKE